MQIKNLFFNKNIQKTKLDKKASNEMKINNNYELDDKVDEFVDWYTKNMVDNYQIRKFHYPKYIRDFIEKMAIWYELRYPSYEINRLMPGSGQAFTKINDVMFKDNSYIKEKEQSKQIDEIQKLEWDKFYNYETFFNSLESREKYFLSKEWYRDYIRLNILNTNAHIHIDSNGYVKSSDIIIKDENSKCGIQIIGLDGMYIKDVVNFLKSHGIKLTNDNELEKIIKEHENREYFIDRLLDCVMYRIIERGGNRFGPRRGFLFAKEFNRNIDIPMMYGADLSDPGLGLFAEEYLSSGGNQNLECLIGYHSRTMKNEKLENITINEIIRIKKNIENIERALVEKEEEKVKQKTL